MILKPECEPVIDVGVLLADRISVHLNGPFTCGGQFYENHIEFRIVESQIVINKGHNSKSNHLIFLSGENATFTVEDIVFGIGFHWERKENLSFQGEMHIVKEDDKLRFINRVKLEDYLKSVIASEMSAKASESLLKAHAVMSRSWLIAQLLQKHKKAKAQSTKQNEIIRWYDREDHNGFDVCADDHCQRYQGITRISNKKALVAIEETRGVVLKHQDEICDARFSKCCGGITERFDTCWEDNNPEYLQAVFDGPDETHKSVNGENNARAFIQNSPVAFCNNTNTAILDQVLNDYDRETPDFFRWKVELAAIEIKKLLKKKMAVDVGEIRDLVSLERGPSGRIFRLKILGSEKEIVIGKELEIRKALSESHLYSSAFIVDKKTDETDGSIHFILHGAGWGHGVGLCQIGAAVMGEKGYPFEEILSHYFKHTRLEKIY